MCRCRESDLTCLDSALRLPNATRGSHRDLLPDICFHGGSKELAATELQRRVVSRETWDGWGPGDRSSGWWGQAVNRPVEGFGARGMLLKSAHTLVCPGMSVGLSRIKVTFAGCSTQTGTQSEKERVPWTLRLSTGSRGSRSESPQFILPKPQLVPSNKPPIHDTQLELPSQADLIAPVRSQIALIHSCEYVTGLGSEPLDGARQLGAQAVGFPASFALACFGAVAAA
jgi:hypothetical protein